MVIWYILAFLYFIAVDALIFFKQWNWLIIALVTGAVFAFIIMATKAFVAPAPKAETQTPPPAANQPGQQTYSYPAVTTAQTSVSEPAKQGSFSMALAFFYGEIVIIIGLVIYLFLKN